MSEGHLFVYTKPAWKQHFVEGVLSCQAFRVSEKHLSCIQGKLRIYAPFRPLRYSFWCVKLILIEGG